MEICAEGIMDAENHQRRNFEKNGITERINDNNLQKAITFCGSHGKKRWIGKSMHSWYDEWEQRKRPPKEKLYR